MAESGSLTVYPSAYDTSDYSFKSINNASNPVGKGSGNTTNAAITINTGSGAESYIFWPFVLTAIPENASIDSVSCSAKGYRAFTNSSWIAVCEFQLYSGSTPKGSSANISNSTTPITLECGAWTRGELSDCRLRIYAKRGTTQTDVSAGFSFYGADLTVEYTVNGQKFMLKLEGAYADIARVFQKIDGIWIEQDDLNNVVVSENGLINGGEYVAPNPVVNIFETGHSTNCYVTINGVKYTSEAKVSVEPGTVITLVMRGSSGSMPGAVFVDDSSQPVQYGTSVTYNHTVTNNIAIQLFYTVSGSSYAGMSFILTGVDANVSYFYADYGSGVFRFPFREGMTWAELCNSRYNILFGATVSGNQIGWSDGSYLADVKPTDVIVAGKTYTRTGL